MHHLEKIPSSYWLQWDLSCFVMSLMSPKWHVLKQVRIARDPWGISQWGFLQVTLRTIWQNVHDPGSGSVTQGHREKWVQKSCVSFEEECIFYSLINIVVPFGLAVAPCCDASVARISCHLISVWMATVFAVYVFCTWAELEAPQPILIKYENMSFRAWAFKGYSIWDPERGAEWKKN